MKCHIKAQYCAVAWHAYVGPRAYWFLLSLFIQFSGTWLLFISCLIKAVSGSFYLYAYRRAANNSSCRPCVFFWAYRKNRYVRCLSLSHTDWMCFKDYNRDTTALKFNCNGIYSGKFGSLACIWYVASPNLDQSIGYPDWGDSFFFISYSTQVPGWQICLQLCYDLFRRFPIFFYPAVFSLKLLTASLNKQWQTRIRHMWTKLQQQQAA